MAVREPAKEVWLSSKQRQKRKFVCTVRGLELFGKALAPLPLAFPCESR